MDNSISRLEAVATRLEAVARKMGGGELAEGEIPPHVTAWGPVAESINDFYKEISSESLGFPAKTRDEVVIKSFKNALQNVGAFIAATATCKKPSNDAQTTFLAPLSDAIKEIDGLTRTRKRSLRKFDLIYKPMLSCLEALTWVYTDNHCQNLPLKHCQTQQESVDFHTFKCKDDVQKVPIKALSKFCKNLVAYVKDNDLKMGLPWNPKGGDLSGASQDAPSTETKTEEASPKKVEVKKAATTKKTTSKKDESKSGGNLFSELGQGLAITSGLKKVKKSQKNKYRKPEERTGKVTIKTRKAKVKKNIKPPANYKKRGMTWFFENNIEGVVTIEEDDKKVNLKSGLFLANNYNCGFIIKPKIKSIVIDSCKKVQVEIHDVVSSIEIVNSQSVTVYCYGQTPAINIDKCDSPKIVLMKKAFEQKPSIITSCITAGNIEFPKGGDEDSFIQLPFPEQFETKIVGDNIETTCVQHAG